VSLTQRRHICQNLQIKQCYKGAVPSHIPLHSGGNADTLPASMHLSDLANKDLVCLLAVLFGCDRLCGMIRFTVCIQGSLLAFVYMLDHCTSIQKIFSPCKIVAMGIQDHRGRMQAGVPCTAHCTINFCENASPQKELFIPVSEYTQSPPCSSSNNHKATQEIQYYCLTMDV
jgi:hypothetical protein